MALSKSDYEQMGNQQFARGECRPLGNSWQSKAMQVGYDLAEKAILDKASAGVKAWNEKAKQALDLPANEKLVKESIAELGNEADKPISLHVQFHNRIGRPIHLTPRQAHISFLHAECLKETNLRRKMRLMAKVNKLTNKQLSSSPFEL